MDKSQIHTQGESGLVKKATHSLIPLCHILEKASSRDRRARDGGEVHHKGVQENVGVMITVILYLNCSVDYITVALIQFVQLDTILYVIPDF